MPPADVAQFYVDELAEVATAAAVDGPLEDGSYTVAWAVEWLRLRHRSVAAAPRGERSSRHGAVRRRLPDSAGLPS